MTIYGSLLSRATHTLKNNRGSALEDVKKQSVERRGGEPQKAREGTPQGETDTSGCGDGEELGNTAQRGGAL